MEILRFPLSLYAFIAFIPFHISSALSVEDSLNLASNAIDKLCVSTIPLHNALQPQKPTINNLSFRHMTVCRNFSVPLAKAQQLRTHKLFNRTKKTVILATGWRNTIDNSNGIREMSEAFFCRNDVNFLVVDMASYMDTMYKSAAINTEEVGRFIAIGLTKLIEIVPLKNIHLVGHSLGAHIVGAAGRTFTQMTNGLLIPRITGLDPAKPCFGDNERLGSLQKSDARLVDVIHSNGGVLGMREPVGHIDFYPDGLGMLQPGCRTIDCAHSRALEYFIESIYPKNEQNFPAHKCQSWRNLELENCAKTPSKRFMGFLNSGPIAGIFYVGVNGQTPFGVNGKKAGTEKCRKTC